MASEFVSGAFVATLTARQTLGEGILDLWFAMKSPGRLPFQAGQFVSMSVGRDAAGLDVRRSFSIASASTRTDAFRLIVRIVPGGTACRFLTTLPLHSDVPMTGPYGFFVLNPEHPGTVVFGATGTGVAAVMPMLDELADRPLGAGERLVYWGARREEDLFAREEIVALCARAAATLHVCLTAPGPQWIGQRGRINGPLLAALPEWKAPTFYLVGNGAMIGELKRELMNRGVDRKKQIRTEAFFD